MRKLAAVVAVLAVSISACRAPRNFAVIPDRFGGPEYDIVIANARIIDGTGGAWYWGDIGIDRDYISRIARRGELAKAKATRRIDAHGLVVTPGFIDIQAQSYDNFMYGDGRALSMVTQGITTAILGEGDTPAPVNDKQMSLLTDSTARTMAARFTGPHGFGQWLDFMQRRGLSENVGSFVGSGTVRSYAKAGSMAPFTGAERDTARAMIGRVMTDGAFGVASALMYPPDNYNTTDDLIESAKAMAPFGGVYITHMRNEGDFLLEAIDEAMRVGREGGVPVEIYHLKAAGKNNWPKIPAALAKIDSARAAGQDVQADMYIYAAAANGFNACIAPKYAADGKLLENLANAALRPQIKADLQRKIDGFENSCMDDPSAVMVVGFTRPELKKYEGKRLTEIAADMKEDWADALIDLNIAEKGALGEILFRMSEDNVRAQLKAPWIKWGTDAGADDPATAKVMVHPRTYGNFTRLLSKYVRDEHVIPLEDAVRKATSAVATRLLIQDRGLIKERMKADLLIFDPATVKDNATFEKPHQLSTGISTVIVNGVEVIRDGAHTGAKPGQVVRGPGWNGWTSPK